MTRRKNTTSKPKSSKKQPKAKKKTVPLNKLKKKLDTIFSKYIRMSRCDEKGFCKCISCGQEKHWKEMQNGHYCSRRHEILRWDLMNCNVQDARCNVFWEGNRIWYRRALVAMYGEDQVIALEDKSLQPSSFKRADIERMIRHYDSKVKFLEKELKKKGIFDKGD